MSKKTSGKRPSRASASTPTSMDSDRASKARPGSETDAASPIVWRGAYALIPAAIAVATSVNSLWNGFAADDSYQVLQNTLIRRLGNIPLAFTRSVWAFVTEDIVFSADTYYRPLFSALFSFNYALFGTRAWGWHLVNVVIHAWVAYLVFIALKDLTQKKWLALLAASLFAAHPAHAESVAWVSGITDPLMSVFVLGSLVWYLRYRSTGRRNLLALSLGLFFLALLCKETAIALPLIIVCLEVFYFTETGALRQRVARGAGMAMWFLVPAFVDIVMRYRALGSLIGGVRTIPFGVGLATMPIATAKYLALLLVPVGYSYQHQTDFVWSMLSREFLGPIALIIVLGAAVLWIRSRVLTFAALWFLVTLAPALVAIRQFEPENVVQERYLYAPSIGFCLALAIFLEWLVRRRALGARGVTVTVSIAAAVTVLWGALSVRQNRIWDSDVALYRNVVAADPGRASAHVALAQSYHSIGRVREADAEAHAAIDLAPDDPRGYVSLAYFANSAGKYSAAIDYLAKAAALGGEGIRERNYLATVHLNLGLIYWQTKDYDRAEESLLKSVAIWPRPVGWYHTGRFYLERGRLEEARSMFELTARNVPNSYPPIHLQLGRVYELLGQKEAARVEYETFLDLAPPDAANRNEVFSRLQNL